MSSPTYTLKEQLGTLFHCSTDSPLFQLLTVWHAINFECGGMIFHVKIHHCLSKKVRSSCRVRFIDKKHTTKTPTKMKWFLCHAIHIWRIEIHRSKDLANQILGGSRIHNLFAQLTIFFDDLPFRWIPPGSLTARPWKITIPRGK